ncbi:MAG: nucleotidyltransferase domain-containing protein [Candidatus Marinimicrobia bacterium]|nr:nucleotidyltransferase domain-containing protein [Candidatus Neomarinimicrobiota bacterium]
MTDISLIIEKVKKIIQKEVDCDYRLFLFGSRAKDFFHEKSDIDIGILSDGPLDAIQMFSIKDKIAEIPTLLKIDFVDFSVVSDDFRTVALKQTKEIVR